MKLVAVNLPSTAAAPQIARGVVAAHADGLSKQVADAAELLVSEVVSNAVLHGRPEISLRVSVDPPRIAIGVDDRGDSLAVQPMCSVEPTNPSGRGLKIVEMIATDWGVTPMSPPPGKTVWFELSD